jgi:hypothetical protein
MGVMEYVVNGTVHDSEVVEDANLGVLIVFLVYNTIEDNGDMAAKALKDLFDMDVGFDLLKLGIRLYDHCRERWGIVSLRREA